MNAVYGVVAVLAVTIATIGIGAFGLRFSRTTSDFYVASRSVSPVWNASAIGGEYLSAASFLGVAGLILAFGADMLWFPVGYTAGYLVMLVLVAAPLRRSGAYTLPDFAEARLESRPVRRIASVLVVLIGWLYLLPQLEGAGLTLHTVTGAPAWSGGALVAFVVILNVISGGMRSITFVQAFQYWLKLTAICLPVIFLLLAWQGDGRPSPADEARPTFHQATTVDVGRTITVRVDTPVVVRVDGVIDDLRHDEGTSVALTRGTHVIRSGTTLDFDAGDEVPHVAEISAASHGDWLLPLSGAGGRDHPLLATYSLVLATFFGTMGLPHVLVRFYTNPDGRAARRTTLIVLVLLSAFYLMPTIYGALGRLYAPDLLLTGRTDAAVLLLPGRLVGGALGDLLGALVTAGAFAAFLSTSSGLAVSVAGVLSQDLLRGSVRDFRLATGLAIIVPLALSTLAAALSVATVVGLAFAVAASSFCPLLVLGIWWRRLTDVGAAAGLLVGGGLATAAVVTTIVMGPQSGWLGTLLAQPAALTVPVAFAVMVLVSLLTPRRVARDVARTMVRLHAPESVQLDRGDFHPERRRRP
ncbi:MAG TPA: cation acetate symporter [Actinomycetes bacterium]|nr:cation acetate symporter [Actinomycetes bacterium]